MNVSFTRSFVVVDINPLELQVAVSVVGTSGVDSVLITDHLPKLSKL